MQLDIRVIDAFTSELFGGNPAAVVITEQWLSEELMQQIGAENNLSETAFLVPNGKDSYSIRWFSPLTEIAFCGHATLASAFILFNQNPATRSLTFVAKAVGQLTVRQRSDRSIEMDFPNTKPEKVERCPQALFEALSIPPAEVYANSQAYFVIYPSQKEVLAVERDNDLLKTLAPLDVVVTARSGHPDFDFVSRYFWPANGGDEDPVTGSIHTGLAPFWAERLGKDELVAFQASKRGGVIHCKVMGERVLICGNAVAYLAGTITVK